MRLRILLTLFVFCIGVSQVPSAHSAVKSGTSCQRAGQVVTSGDKKYTCIKNGKKLQWNNGVRFKAASPGDSPTPIPTPSSSPTPTPSPSADTVLIGINKSLNLQIPTVNIKSVEKSSIGELVVEDGVNPKNVEYTEILLRKLLLAQPVMKLAKPPVVILGHTESFVKTEFSKRCSQNIDWVGTGDNTMSKYNNWALAGCLYTNPVQIIPMPKDLVAVSHIAGALGSDMGYVAIGLSPNTKLLPGWFVRGLKGVVGEYMESISEPSWKVAKNGAESCTSFSLKELSYSYELTKNWCQTSLGQGVSRYMVAKKGLSATLSFINELQRRGSWSESDFETFLGMNFGDFELQAKDYIIRQSHGQ